MARNNNCRHWNKFALALYDNKDWTKFSVTTFKQPCVGGHSFLKCDWFAYSQSQPCFKNQCFCELLILFSNHVCEITLFPGLVGL